MYLANKGDSESTVHSESIQTTLLFQHSVTLQPYSKMDGEKKILLNINTQYPIMTKQKQVFRNVWKCIIKNNHIYKQWLVKVFTPLAFFQFCCLTTWN